MSAEFLKMINEYIIDSIIECDDDEYLSNIGKDGYSSQEDIDFARSFIQATVRELRQERLNASRERYAQSKSQKSGVLDTISTTKPLQEMLTQIISVMQSEEQVPDGLLIAFREQGKTGSEEGIRNIWKSLVELGLIDPEKDENSK